MCTSQCNNHAWRETRNSLLVLLLLCVLLCSCAVVVVVVVSDATSDSVYGHNCKYDAKSNAWESDSQSPRHPQPSMTKNSSSSRAPKKTHLPGDPGTSGKNAKVTHMHHFCVPSQLPQPCRNCTCGTSRRNCLDHQGLSLHNDGRVPIQELHLANLWSSAQ